MAPDTTHAALDPRHTKRRLVVAIVVFLICTAIGIGLAIEFNLQGAHMVPLDAAFCYLTFTNCTPHNPYTAITPWPELLKLNAAVFGFWLFYALCARGFVVGKTTAGRLVSGFFAVMIPVIVLLLGTGLELLQGASM